MQVLHLLDTTAWAGTEAHLICLNEALCKKATSQHSFSIAAPKHSPVWNRAVRTGATGLDLQPNAPLSIRSLKRLVRALRLQKVDILHAHNGRTALHAALAVQLAQKGHFIYTQHFIDPAHTKRSTILRRISAQAHQWVNRRCAHVLAISHAVKTAAIRRDFQVGAKISTIHNGVEPPTTEPSPQHTARCRQALGITPSEKVIFCAARLDTEKDIPVLLQALHQLRPTQPEAKAYIAGSGPLHEHLTNQINHLGLAHTVHLLGHVENVQQWMHAMDVFVLPSRAEAFGLVLLEAMMAAKPIIACNSGGPREIVLQGRTGLLIEPNRPSLLAKAIRQYLGNRKLRLQQGLVGREHAMANFSAEAMAEKTLTLYKRLLMLR